MTIMWTIYWEIDDGPIAESRSDNTVQDLLRVFIDDCHNFVNYDNLRLAENDSCKTQQLDQNNINIINNNNKMYYY